MRISRRRLLQAGLLASGGALASAAAQTLLRRPALAATAAKSAWCGIDPADAVARTPGTRAGTLRPYVDALPIPPVLRAQRGARLALAMRPGVQTVHSDLPPTTIWGYGGRWPGPTIEAASGESFTVEWRNTLPLQHLLPIDHGIHGAERAVPAVRTAVHVHGARVLPESDGYPDAWITSDGRTGAAHVSAAAHYPNEQPASTLWYHDHALGIARLNLYAGLAGLYLIRDRAEQALRLPSGAYEIPLLLQDRQFNRDGSLRYPVADHGTHPIWIQEFFGDTNCVNGRAAPFLDLEPRRYRFRIVNGSNSRFYHLSLQPSSASGEARGSSADAPPFQQVGSDAGLLPAPLELHYLLLAPGERCDLVIDFKHCRGQHLALVNDAPAPYTRGGEAPAREVMLLRVIKPLAGADRSAVPPALVPFEPLASVNANVERVLAVTELDRPSDGYTQIGLLGQKHWSDPVSESPRAGSTEIWSFANATGDVHAMHVHLVRFQVLNRQAFDVQTFQRSGKLVLSGTPMPPERNERPAWKDTIKSYPGYLTRVIQKFELPSGAEISPGKRFRYVWHCHMLEHEDNEMMRPYDVVA